MNPNAIKNETQKYPEGSEAQKIDNQNKALKEILKKSKQFEDTNEYKNTKIIQQKAEMQEWYNKEWNLNKIQEQTNKLKEEVILDMLTSRTKNIWVYKCFISGFSPDFTATFLNLL